MTLHDQILELAAAAIDFPLTPPERRRIDAHLADCAACARRIGALSRDARMVASLVVPVLPERRQAEILDALLRPPSRVSPLRLVAIAALLALALVSSLIVGSELVRRTQDDLSMVLLPSNEPVATDGRGATPSPTLSAEASATPEPAPITDREWVVADVPAPAPDRPTGWVYAVAPVGQGFVAVGRGCVGDPPTCEATVWTSADGSTWERAPASQATDISGLVGGPTIDGMVDVVAGGPGVVAIGSDTIADKRVAMAWLSTDGGTTWTRGAIEDSRIPPGASSLIFPRLNAVAWTGERFVAVGEDWSDWDGDFVTLAGATSRAAVWTSADGLAWTRVEADEVFDAGGFVDTGETPMAGGMAGVVAGSNGLVAVGQVCPPGSTSCETAAWTSPDGLAWARAAGMPTVRGGIDSVAASDDGYVAVGSVCDEAAGGCTALALVSPDGQTWTEHPMTDTDRLEAVTRVGDRFVAVAPNATTKLWRSSDGVTWQELPEGPAEAVGDTEWQLAANGNTAVWVGSSPSTEGPRAWLSR